ncbi:MAG TPA: SprB repeat-containing protein, partial [Bacteroidia bacterium]|nr:SprB repeat-containing protein [Bacteroidia bacterium]
NCVFSQGFSINNLGGPSSVATTIANENCTNGAGSVIITGVTGGLGPYSYNFNSLGFSFSTSYLGLAAGTYSLIVQDGNLCTFSTTVNVGNNPGPAGFTAIVTNSNCGSSDGDITINSVTGGAAPYEYSNGGVTYLLTNQFTGLGAGIYDIYVRDSNGCIYIEQVTIGNLGGLTVDLFPINETCGFANGSISAVINGGTPLYNILWSNGDTIQDIFGLVAGNYSITVTDATGCVGVANTTIVNSVISLTATVTDASCGNNTGAIDLSVSGGDGAYFYLWNNGEFNEDIDTLFAGSYDVLVNDYTGCTATASYIVNDTPSITNFTTIVTDATCGTNDGSITVDFVDGGTAPYDYYIDGVSQGNINSFINLSAGNYQIKVEDAVGCEFELPFAVNTTPSITAVNTSVGDETCGELNGSFTFVSVVGGIAPYSYSFNGSPFTSQTFYTGLNNGIYNYEVIDNLGCNFIGSTTIASIGAVTSINTIITPETCGNSNGSIEVTAAIGGTPPYEYALNSGAYSNNPIFVGLPAGNDTILVKDNIGCIFQQIVSVGGTAAAVANAGFDITVCENSMVTLTASGGVSYIWDNSLGNTSIVNFTAIASSNYIVEVTDVNGCTDTDTVTVTVNLLPIQPIITTSGPTTFCFGNSVDLSSSYVGGNTWSTS